MADNGEKKSYPLRMREVFARPDQPLSDFMAELKALTKEDRADFVRWLNEAGIPTAE